MLSFLWFHLFACFYCYVKLRTFEIYDSFVPLHPPPRKLCRQNEKLCKICGEIVLMLMEFAPKLCACCMVMVYTFGQDFVYVKFV